MRGELRGALRKRRRGLAALGGVWRRVARAGGARPAVPAVPRGARRHQVAARGPRAVPAALRRRHRGVAGAAAAGRRAAGAARAAEAQVRADAGRRHRAARRAAARAGRSRARRRAASPSSSASSRPRAPRYLDAARSAVGGAAPRRRATFARRLEAAARRAGDGADAVRGPVRASRCPEAAWTRAAASTRPSSSSRRILARICGRWPASCPAASCRASCSRSRR